MAHLRKISKKLSDGSEVFNVLVYSDYTGSHEYVEFPCVTEADADAFIETMLAAIEAHTNEDLLATANVA